MPIYEYGCHKCGKQFEFMQSMSEPPKKRCPECKGKLERLLSSTSFVLKGGGWYKDLYSSPKPDAKGGGDGDSGGGESKSSEKSESKSDKSEKSDKKSDKPSSSEKASTKKASKTSASKSK